MRDAQVVMLSSLRDSVDKDQRHSVTEFRLNGRMATVGNRIKALRAKRGMSRQQLADLAGIAYSTLAGIEDDAQKSSTKLHAIARALETSAEYLAGENPSEDRADISPAPLLTPRELALLLAYRLATKDVKQAIEGAAGISSPFKKTAERSVEKKRRAP